jgi:Protein of unknown function (DUF3887)
MRIRNLMKVKSITCFLIAVLMLAAVSWAGDKPDQTAAKAEKPSVTVANAQELLSHLAKGEFQAATSKFDSAMSKQFPARKLEEVWKTIIAQAGDFQKPLEVQTGHVQDYDIVEIKCNFAKTPLVMRVVFNSAKQVTGLFFHPV